MIKCVEIWVVAGLPWPHVQFQPQMGLMGGPGLCVAHFPPDIATQGNLKSSRKKVWSGQVSDSFQSLLFFSTTRVGLYKVNWSADPAQSEKFKPDPNEVTRWWHFLGKAGSAPPTNIDLCSRFEIYPLQLWTQTSGSFAVITDPLPTPTFYFRLNIKGYR